jgi:hypothetical protein
VAERFANRYGTLDNLMRELNEYGELITRTWGNEADALRHFAWNAANARVMSVDQAIATSNAHEINSLINDGWNLTDILPPGIIAAKLSRGDLMDLWNNRVGIELGSRSDLSHKCLHELFMYARNHQNDNIRLILNSYDVDAAFGLNSNLFGYPYWRATAIWDILGFNVTLWNEGVVDPTWFIFEVTADDY